jgi:hypothetical protein
MDTIYLCNMKWTNLHILKHAITFARLFACAMLPMAGSVAYSQEREAVGRTPLINEWEIGYGAGSPFGATEWRSVKNSEFTQKFSQMWQVNFGHQFTSKDYGAAPKGYYYPSLGMFFQWLDYSHLKIRGVEPIFPVTKTADYGQIATFGLTLHQYCWVSGKWRGSLNHEMGAAYVFDPVYEVPSWVTLSKPWQIFVGFGWFFGYEIKGGEIAFGPQFTHLSNSGLANYNTGINNFSLSVRYRHKALKEIQKCRPEEALIEKDGRRFRSHFYGSVMAGYGKVYFEDPNSAVQITMMADAMYRIDPNNGIGIGVDYYHNDNVDRTDRKDYIGAGIKYDRWFGPFVIHVQVGTYLNGKRPIKYKGTARIYENVGYKYVMFRQKTISPYIGFYTKGNGFEAEQMSFALGCIFSK